MKKGIIFFGILFFNCIYGDIGDKELKLQYAIKLFEEGKYRESLEKFQEITIFYPNTKQAKIAFYYLGSSYVSLKNYSNAEKIFQKIIKDYFDDKWLMEKVLFEMGYSYTMEGKYNEGIEKFTKFMERFPNSKKIEDCLYNLSKCYYGLKDYTKSIEICERIIKKFPQSKIAPKAFIAKANSYYMKNDYTKALNSYQEAMKRYPQKQSLDEYLIYVGICYYRLKEYKKAIKSFQNFLNAYPESPHNKDALYFLWKSYDFLKKYDSLLKFYKEFIKNHPKNSNLNYIHHLMAIAYSKKGKFNEDLLRGFIDFSNAICEVIKSKGYKLRYTIFKVIGYNYFVSRLGYITMIVFQSILFLLVIFILYRKIKHWLRLMMLGIFFCFIFFAYSPLVFLFPAIFCLFNYKKTNWRSQLFFFWGFLILFIAFSLMSNQMFFVWIIAQIVCIVGLTIVIFGVENYFYEKNLKFQELYKNKELLKGKQI